MSAETSAIALTDRVALVTGAARGIGRATAIRLAELGCRVAAADRNATELSNLDRSGIPLTVRADVTVQADVDTMIDEVTQRLGGLDILVNNAALAAPRRPRDGIDLHAFEKILRANTAGAYLCTKIAAPHLAASQRAGSVVNVSSIAASRAFRQGIPYVASKGALEATTRALALDLAPAVRVNAVAPGMVATESWQQEYSEEQERRSSLIPLGRPARAREVAEAICFLASPAASYATGHVLAVDGGLSAQAYTPADEEPLMQGAGEGG